MSIVDGRKSSLPGKVKTNQATVVGCRVTRDELKKFKIICNHRGMSMNGVLRELFVNFMDSYVVTPQRNRRDKRELEEDFMDSTGSEDCVPVMR